MRTLVIRFSSLGDVVLASAVTAGLEDVVFVTHQRYAGLVASFPGVKEVIGLYPEEGVKSLRSRIPKVDRIVDLHASPRSRVLCRGLGAPVSRVRRYDWQRRMRVAFKTRRVLPTVVKRYAETAGVDPVPLPWIPIERAASPTDLVLIPHALHATKCWPREYYARLAQEWPGEVVALGGPGEQAQMDALVRESAGAVRGICERGFEGALDAFSRARWVVGGDTGLVHLAAACGVEVLGIFGPTTSSDGFWNARHQSVEASLACRPCSLHGGPGCPLGDHLCMREIQPDRVGRVLETGS